MEKDFFEVFPNLKVEDKLQELLDGVQVTKVAANSAKDRLRVYLLSRQWIHKKYIYDLEEAISSQFFPGVSMEVKIIEKFSLSSQYTPENLYEVYRNSRHTVSSSIICWPQQRWSFRSRNVWFFRFPNRCLLPRRRKS